jgi:hypothetical protein
LVSFFSLLSSLFTNLTLSADQSYCGLTSR